ncbi:MAG: hypothetical protein AAF478_03540 [Pseudomonadota bacterium]
MSVFKNVCGRSLSDSMVGAGFAMMATGHEVENCLTENNATDL